MTDEPQREDEVSVDSDLCILLDFAWRSGWWQAASSSTAGPNETLVNGILVGLVELGLSCLHEGDASRPTVMTEDHRQALASWVEVYSPGHAGWNRSKGGLRAGRVAQALSVLLRAVDARRSGLVGPSNRDAEISRAGRTSKGSPGSSPLVFPSSPGELTHFLDRRTANPDVLGDGTWREAVYLGKDDGLATLLYADTEDSGWSGLPGRIVRVGFADVGEAPEDIQNLEMGRQVRHVDEVLGVARSMPQPPRAYALGLRQAVVAESVGQTRGLDAVARSYEQGFFAALDAVLGLLVGHQEGTPEAALWRLVREVRDVAQDPVDLANPRAADPLSVQHYTSWDEVVCVSDLRAAVGAARPYGETGEALARRALAGDPEAIDAFASRRRSMLARVAQDAGLDVEARNVLRAEANRLQDDDGFRRDHLATALRASLLAVDLGDAYSGAHRTALEACTESSGRAWVAGASSALPDAVRALLAALDAQARLLGRPGQTSGTPGAAAGGRRT